MTVRKGCEDMKLICYLSNGYPSLKDTRRLADVYLEAGADMVEIDIPCDHPFLEGPFIADRMQKALAVTSDYEDYLDSLALIREKHPDGAFLLLVYERTVKKIGPEKFITFCRKNRFFDIVLAGAKDERLKAGFIERGLRISTFVRFHLPEEDLAAIPSVNGFVYLQAKPKEEVPLPFATIAEIIGHLRDTHNVELPIYAGSGVRDEDDIRCVKEAGADAVFVGYTVLKLFDDENTLKERIRSLKQATL